MSKKMYIGGNKQSGVRARIDSAVWVKLRKLAKRFGVLNRKHPMHLLHRICFENRLIRQRPMDRMYVSVSTEVLKLFLVCDTVEFVE